MELVVESKWSQHEAGMHDQCTLLRLLSNVIGAGDEPLCIYAMSLVTVRG